MTRQRARRQPELETGTRTESSGCFQHHDKLMDEMDTNNLVVE